MLEVTERAWREIKQQSIKRGRPKDWILLGVSAGGCNGFQYIFHWIEPMIAILNSSRLIEDPTREHSIFVDEKSYRLIGDMTIDFDPLKGFQFSNPRATSACGCGMSVEFDLTKG